ncbi:MAG: hypothetical protein JO249_17620 [Acidobacteria bacterium]|nr:hypothetical protein [Acidobacteriota bacterium]
MRKLVGFASLLCLFSMLSLAQETPKPEVYAGYQFTSTDGGWHGNGWNTGANLYILKWLGATGDFSGVYGSSSSLYTYTFGPTVSTHKHNVSPFGHALFGGAHVGGPGWGDSGMAMMFGGGVDLGRQKFALRAFQVDWMALRFNGFTDKNNLRVNTGLMYRF